MIHANGVETLYYTYTDFQGSLIALTDANGGELERFAYDPWGVRRSPDNWTEKDNRSSRIVDRGYTGHEHLDAFGIINMNGRVYDPLTAQFLSPDPILTDAGNWLDYNRFGYCLNNPFRYTDPSGYTWWAENGVMVIATAASIVVGGVVLGPTGAGIPAIIQSGMLAGAAGGFTGGVVGTVLTGGSFGDAIVAGLQGATMGAVIGGFTTAIGGIFGPVGSMAANATNKFNIWNELGRAGAHTLVQGGFSVARGGDFWEGAAAGFASSFAGSLSQGVGIDGWGMVGVSTGMGGVGAAIAGGSAEDVLFGMVSGAMVGILNHGADKAKSNRIEYKFFKRLREHYEDATGEDIRLTKKEFDYLISKGRIIWRTQSYDSDTGKFSVLIDFYDSNRDLKFSFGRATVSFIDRYGEVIFTDFYDEYNFDPKPWGTRTFINEVITRSYDIDSSGRPFRIIY